MQVLPLCVVAVTCGKYANIGVLKQSCYCHR